MSEKKKRTYGEGTVYYSDTKGKYVGQISAGKNLHGKRIRKTVYGNTKSEVIKKMKQTELLLMCGKYTEKSKITFINLAREIIKDKLMRNEIRQSTYNRHEETLKILKPLHDIPVQKINEKIIRDFLYTITNEYSQSVINKIFCLISGTLKEALRLGIIRDNPIIGIKKPKSSVITQRVRALTKSEQKKFIAVLNSEKILYKEQMLISLFTGMRMGEINALSKEDIDFEEKKIHIKRTICRGKKGEALLGSEAKTKAGNRTIPISPDVCALLKSIMEKADSELIFKRNDRLITTSMVCSVFRRTLKKYEILNTDINDGKIDLHSLRHTFGTRCAESGMPPKVLQEIMGHTDISVTMNTYFYATEDYIKDNFCKFYIVMAKEGLTAMKR